MLDRIYKTAILANNIGNISDYYNVIPSESNRDKSEQKYFFAYLIQSINKWIPILSNYDFDQMSRFRSNLARQLDLKKWVEKFNKLKNQNKTLIEEKSIEQFKKDADIINKLNIEKSSKVKLSTEQLSKIKFNIEDKINKTENAVLKKNPNSRKTTQLNNT